MARASEKPAVFSALFERRYDNLSGVFTPATVTSQELQDLIMVLQQEMGLSLQVGNPANFLKDFLRMKSRNEIWPPEIAAAGFTARQIYSAGRVFDFVAYEPGQLVAFPDEFLLPAEAVIHSIESVSLPSTARALGRPDEAWLIQVCVHQRLLETHLALFSDIDVIDLFHLQNSLKGTPEIDAVFLLVFMTEEGPKKALVTLEAKRDEPVLPDQIRSQVAVMAKQARKRPALSDIEYVLPVAATTLNRDGQRIVAIFEMEMISVVEGLKASKTNTPHDLPIEIVKSVGYSLVPTVSGV